MGVALSRELTMINLPEYDKRGLMPIILLSILFSSGMYSSKEGLVVPSGSPDR